MDDIAEWLSEEAPWAVGHLRMRIGPEEHWDEAAKALLDKCGEAAAEIIALRAHVALVAEMERQNEALRARIAALRETGVR